MKTNILLENLEYDISNLNNFYNGYIILFKGVYIFSEYKGIEKLTDVLSENPSFTEIKDKLKDLFTENEKENIGDKKISVSKIKYLKIYNLKTQKEENLENYPKAQIIPCSIYIESTKRLRIGSMILFTFFCLFTFLGESILKNPHINEIIVKNKIYLGLTFLLPFLFVIIVGLGYAKIFEYYIQNNMLRNLENK